MRGDLTREKVVIARDNQSGDAQVLQLWQQIVAV
jgi:hypothetical protein